MTVTMYLIFFFLNKNWGPSSVLQSYSFLYCKESTSLDTGNLRDCFFLAEGINFCGVAFLMNANNNRPLQVRKHMEQCSVVRCVYVVVR